MGREEAEAGRMVKNLHFGGFLNENRAVSRMSTRSHNEKKFGHWEELEDGGRRYSLEVAGRQGWLARYFKEVTADETTLRFWQEIYDDTLRLVEIHEKFPVDRGHQKV